jgi:hypothetical protein
MKRRPVPSALFACTLALAANAWAGVLDDVANDVAGGAAGAPGPPVRITTRVEPASVTIGTRFRYTMRIEPAPGVQVAVPAPGERLGGFEIVDFGKSEGAGNSGVLEAWYELVGYETGAQHVGPVPIAYLRPGAEPEQIEAPRAVIDVTSLLGGPDAANELRDIKEAVPVREPLVAPWMIGAAAAAAAVLALAAYRLHGRRRRAASAPVRAPHEIALEALDRLRAERFVERGQFETYYVRLSGLVREYVEARFGLRAPEMTTDEFLAAAQRGRDLGSAHRLALGEFLSEADLVKFARHVPSRERAERAWSAARELVEATRPREEASSAAA